MSNNIAFIKRKLAAGFFSLAWLSYASSAAAALVISTTNQNGATPFTPTWSAATNSLIAGLSPSSSAGDFSLEVLGRNINSLTAGRSLTLDLIAGTFGNTGSTNYVTCGNGYGAGSSLVYTLPVSTNGYNVTNITVYSGWADNGRDAQAYVVSYSTVINPTVFTVLTTVNYNPLVSGGVASAIRKGSIA